MGKSIHQYQDIYLEYSLSRWDIHINFFDLFSFTAFDAQIDFGCMRRVCGVCAALLPSL